MASAFLGNARISARPVSSSPPAASVAKSAGWGTTFHPTTNNLFVIDGGIKEFDGTTGAFQGDFGETGVGNLSGPRGIVFHPVTSNLFVSDNAFEDVRQFDGVTGEFLGAFGDTGSINPLYLDTPSHLTFRIDPEPVPTLAPHSIIILSTLLLGCGIATLALLYRRRASA